MKHMRNLENIKVGRMQQENSLTYFHEHQHHHDAVDILVTLLQQQLKQFITC